MNSIAINTSQNVNLDFTVASIGDRIAAFVIDMLIKICYVVLIYFIFIEIANFDSYLYQLDDWSIMAIIGLVLLPVEIYTLVFESLMEGQTPGKKMMHIKVVKKDGYQAKFSDYLIRWFFRLVDIFISSGMVGIISMIFSPHNQRLGGIASGTAVISLKQKAQIDHTILKQNSENYVPKFQSVLLLSDRDMQIIKSNFQTAQRNKDYQLISELAQKIREITNISEEKPPMNDQEFIRRIIQDFNYYTGQQN